MTVRVPFRKLIKFARGGGWGSDKPLPGHMRVAVIRGTDFAAVRSRRTKDVPRRWERDSKLPQRILRPGDVVLEVSGGSSARGQPTGRTLFIDEAVLSCFDTPVIPASFCRVIRFVDELVDARYAFYGLQDMYLSGRTAEYENQSTGISNFQFEYFLDAETLRLPGKEEQRAIATVLGALDDKIAVNERIVNCTDELGRATYLHVIRSCQEDELQFVALGELVEHLPGKYIARKNYVEGGPYIVYGSNSVMGSHREFLYEGPFTVMARIGSNCGALMWSGRPAWVNNNASALRAKAGTDPWFAHHVLQGVDMDQHRAGSGQPFIRIDSLLNARVAVPSHEKQLAVATVLRAYLERAEAAKAESRALGHLRDTLLPGLMSGAIRVRDAEKIAEDVT